MNEEIELVTKNTTSTGFDNPEQKPHVLEENVINWKPMDSSLNKINHEEIDLKELILKLWLKKFQILIVTTVFALTSVIFSLSLPNIYSSNVKLVSTESSGQGGMQSLASKYGGLAAMAGINLGSQDGNSLLHATELVNSWPFMETFVEKYELQPKFMAVTGWDEDSRELIYDESLYDEKAMAWKYDAVSSSGQSISLKPTSFETYQEITKNFIKVTFDEESGIFEVLVNHYSPDVAFEVSQHLVNEINRYFKTQDQKEAEASIAFIQDKIKTTSNTDMLEVFYNMIESHTQTIMLTEVNEEYLIKTLVPAKVAEQKSSPKRALISIIGTIIGFFIAVFWVVCRNFMSETYN